MAGYGDLQHPIARDPWEYIVGVHWGGNIVIAEVPKRLCFLASIDPPDPEGVVSASKIYGTGDSVPESDYALTLNVTADIAINSNVLKNLSNRFVPEIAILQDGAVYPISGNSIPGPTFTYDGNGGLGPFGGGALSADATLTVNADPVTISMDYYFEVLTFDGHITDYSTIVDSTLAGPVHYEILVDVFSYQVIGSGAVPPPPDASTLPGIEESYNMFFSGQFGPYDMQDFIIATYYSAFGPNGLGNEITYNGQKLQGDTPGFPVNYRGPGPGAASRAWLTQVKFQFDETTTTFIVDFDRTSDVAIMQKSLPPLSFILPGYSPGHGVSLRAYDSDVDLVVGADHRVHAFDSNTGLPAPEIWTALVSLDPVAPGGATQLAHFNGDGLL